MDNLPLPRIHSRFLVEIPEVFIQYDPAALDRWKAAQPAFDQSGRKRYSLYGRYAPLARDGKFLLPYSNSPRKRFPEFHTAHLLEDEGFECWGQVQLFEDPRPLFVDGEPVRNGKGNAVRNTQHVRGQVRGAWPWPSDIQQSLAFQPRNPDVVGYRPRQRGKWLFCEVKGPGDGVSGEHFTAQLNALAVLHLLTGSPVAIVRPVPQGGPARPGRFYPARIGYKRGASLDWIRE
jgi:hypothetical protein